MTSRSLPRRRRTDDGWLAGAGVIGLLALATLLIVAQSTLAMWLLGIAHDTDERVPAFGFWTTFILLGVYDVVVGFSSGKK